jgi:hypothetical protein
MLLKSEAEVERDARKREPQGSGNRVEEIDGGKESPQHQEHQRNGTRIAREFVEGRAKADSLPQQ